MLLPRLSVEFMQTHWHVYSELHTSRDRCNYKTKQTQITPTDVAFSAWHRKQSNGWSGASSGQLMLGALVNTRRVSRHRFHQSSIDYAIRR